MKRFRQIGGILLAGCLLLAGGCVNLSQLKQPGVETAFYTLEYEAPQINARGIDCILRVKPFTATPLFNTSTIVYRGKPNETAEYIYHRWHMTPAEMTGDCLARDLNHSGLFKAVFSPASLRQADYVVEGHLYKFL